MNKVFWLALPDPDKPRRPDELYRSVANEYIALRGQGATARPTSALEGDGYNRRRVAGWVRTAGHRGYLGPESVPRGDALGSRAHIIEKRENVVWKLVEAHRSSTDQAMASVTNSRVLSVTVTIRPCRSPRSINESRSSPTWARVARTA